MTRNHTYLQDTAISTSAVGEAKVPGLKSAVVAIVCKWTLSKAWLWLANSLILLNIFNAFLCWSMIIHGPQVYRVGQI